MFSRPAAALVAIALAGGCVAAPSPSTVEAWLLGVASDHPGRVRVQTIGRSREGRPILAAVLGPQDDDGTVPTIWLDAGMHGDETSAVEVLTRFVEEILARPGALDRRRLVVAPMLNPDGVLARRRENAAGVDLNRNHAVGWRGWPGHGAEPFSEPETRAMRDAVLARPMSVCANMHGGIALVAAPWDHAAPARGDQPAEEQTLLLALAAGYTHAGSFLTSSDLYRGGDDAAVVGGDWHYIYGSEMDFLYGEAGCLSLTIEAGAKRAWAPGDGEAIWQQNRQGLWWVVDAAGTGVSGRITDAGGAPIAGAVVTRGAGELRVRTAADGGFHRVLLPGTHRLTFAAPGFRPESRDVEVVAGEATPLDVALGR